MKSKSLLAAIAFIGLAPVVASAQCPSCEGPNGGPPPLPGGASGEVTKKATTNIILRYFTSNVEVKPTGLKAALEKVKTVDKVELASDASNTAVVTFTGKCDQLNALEAAATAAGYQALVLNHAHVLVTLKPLKGADLKGAREAITQLDAVAGVTSPTGPLELHANLEKLTMDDLKAAVARFNCEVVVNQSFEYVKYRVVEGELDSFRRAVGAIKGVMVVREDGANTLGMWIHKTFVKNDRIEKVPGVKVSRT